MTSPENPSFEDAASGAEKVEKQQQMISQERTALRNKFEGASGKVRALATAFVLSSALSASFLRTPEKSDTSPEKADAPVVVAVEKPEEEEIAEVATVEEVEEEPVEYDKWGREAKRILRSLPEDIQEENMNGASQFLEQAQVLPEGAELIESKDSADIYSLGEGEKLEGKYAVVDERFDQIIFFESKSREHASVWGRDFVAFNPSMDRAFRKAMDREKRLARQGFLEVGALEKYNIDLSAKYDKYD